jgi:hypothetical protein
VPRERTGISFSVWGSGRLFSCLGKRLRFGSEMGKGELVHLLISSLLHGEVCLQENSRTV